MTAPPVTKAREQIEAYIAALPSAKRDDVEALHRLVLQLAPDAELWFLDGRNEDGKIVSNPSIGYGRQTQSLSGGKTGDFYKVGISANTSGISVYIMGLDEKTYLSRTFGERIGKAKVTGYCIKFSALKAIDLAVLEEAIRFGLGDQV